MSTRGSTAGGAAGARTRTGDAVAAAQASPTTVRTPAGVSVYYHDGVTRAIAARLIGRGGDAQENLARLTGARPGDTVRVYQREVIDQRGARSKTNGLEIAVVRPGYRFTAEVVRGIGGTTLLDPDMRNDEKSGASGREMVRTLAAMRAMGIDRIAAVAAGPLTARLTGKAYNGYYTWARLGFTGKIYDPTWRDGVDPSYPTVARRVLAEAQARFGPSVTRVEQVMAQPGGAAWWKQHGIDFQARLDLRRGPGKQVIDGLLARMNQHEGH